MIHYHCILYPSVPREHSSQCNKQCFHEETIKQILLYWVRNSPSYFPSPSPILLIFKVTMAKGFSDNISREKNFSLSLTQVGGIYLFLVSLSPLLWERMLLFKKFTTKQWFRSPKLSHEEHFQLFISPHTCPHQGWKKVLERTWRQVGLREGFYHWVIDWIPLFCVSRTHPLPFLCIAFSF